MFDPNQIIQMIKNGANPQQLMMQYLQTRFSGTPFGDNLISLAQNNQTAEIEKIVRNIYQQRGMDFDKEFAAFKKYLGL